MHAVSDGLVLRLAIEVILTIVLALVLAQRVAASPPELTGVLDSELTAGTPWANVSCNKATTVERSVLPEDLVREGSVWSCMMLEIAPIGPRRARFIERRGREPVLWLDDNNDGRFEARESHEFPQTGDLQVRIPITGARFPEYPITVRYRWEFFEPPADPSSRILLESAIAYVGGTVTVGGRPVRVEYPILPDMMPTITGGWFRIDANGDGHIDDDLLSEENTPPSTKVPIVRVGNHYVSTLSIDTDTGIVKLKEHPPSDYQRIVFRVGDQLPDFTYQDLTTRTPRALSDIHARLVLLVVWSSWCPPALDELPWIEEASRTLGGQGLVVLGLPDDEKRGDVEPVISRFHITWPNADPESIRTVLKDRWQIAGVPQFIVLDGDRRIVAFSHNFDTSLRGAQLSKTLQQWLRESRLGGLRPGAPRDMPAEGETRARHGVKATQSQVANCNRNDPRRGVGIVGARGGSCDGTVDPTAITRIAASHIHASVRGFGDHPI